MDPVGRHVTHGLRADLDRANFAFGELQQHHAATGLPGVDFGSVRLGVDVSAREKILATDFTGPHPRDPEDHVAGVCGRLEVRHFVGQRVGSGLSDERAIGVGVLVEAGEVCVRLHVAICRALEVAPGEVYATDSRFPQLHSHSSRGPTGDRRQLNFVFSIHSCQDRRRREPRPEARTRPKEP